MTSGQIAYNRAMKVSDDLIHQMRTASPLTHAARKITTDIWARRHNVPFLTTIYESVREMKDATDQKPERSMKISALPRNCI